jgi:hypothetical protein
LIVEQPPGSKRKSPTTSTEPRAKKTAKKTGETKLPTIEPAIEKQPPRVIVPDRKLNRPLADLSWPQIAPPNPIQPISVFATLDDDKDVTTDTTSPSSGSLTLIRSPPPVPDPDIPSTDLPYFSFFLEEMYNVLPYVNLFPAAPSSVFTTSLHHPALRHSVLSISALISDKKSERGRRRALEHLHKSLKLLQGSLSAVEVDEGVAISIFLLAYFNVSSGEHASARKHLAGLSMVLAQLHTDHVIKNGGFLSPYAMSPCTMLVWRMAIRMDFIISIMYGLRPVFPMYHPLHWRN